MSLLSHDRYQYDSLILSKQTWTYPRQHLQQLLWCVVSVRLNLPEIEERNLCPLRYYASCVSTTLTVLILHNVESVYFFYSNPVYSLGALCLGQLLSSISMCGVLGVSPTWILCSTHCSSGTCHLPTLFVLPWSILLYLFWFRVRRFYTLFIYKASNKR